MHHTTQSGFSLVELIVAVALLVLFSTAFFIQFGQFNRSIFLSSLAYDVALTFRQAQVFSISVAESDSPDNFDRPYGVHFDEDHNGSYILFEDGSGATPQVYDYTMPGPFCPTSPSECVTEFTFKPNFSISDFCVTPITGPPEQCNSDGGAVTNIDILFQRPNPDAIIKVGGAGSYQSARIEIQSPNGTLRNITVSNTGQISVAP